MSQHASDIVKCVDNLVLQIKQTVAWKSSEEVQIQGVN